jgi:hypothetical protein
MTAAVNRKKPDAKPPGPHDRPGLVVYSYRGTVASGSLRFFENSDAETGGRGPLGVRRGDVIAPIGSRKTIAPVVRDSAAAATGTEVSPRGLHWCTDAGITSAKRHFLPLFGPPGAAPRRHGLMGKALQHHEIGHDPRSARPSQNRVARVHRKRHIEFH